jgi:probable rRNA maturation factor
VNAGQSHIPVAVDVMLATDEAALPDDVQWSRWVSAALEAGLPDDSLPGRMTVRLVGSEESRQLNSTYRQKNRPTNVLAFAGPDEIGLPPESDRELGDLVICLPVVYSEALEQGKDAGAHMAHLVVHGTLHLVGYDHEDAAAAEQMESLETRIMATLGFSDPYASH